MSGRYELEDQSVVEFQLGNKQLLLLFVGLLVICAIFFFIGLRVGEDTARSKSALMVSDDLESASSGQDKQVSSEKPTTTTALTLPTQNARAENQAGRRSSNSTPDIKKPATQPETQAASKPAATAAGGYYLQVASPRDESSARKLQATLSAKHPTIIQPVVVNGRTHYRVRVGPFPSSEKAMEFKRSLHPKFQDAIVAKI
jgi:cell division septation protein DedD